MKNYWKRGRFSYSQEKWFFLGSHQYVFLSYIIIFSRILVARPSNMTRYLTLIKTRRNTCWKSNFQLNKFIRLKHSLKRLNWKFISTSQTLLRSSHRGLSRKIIVQWVVFWHIVKNNQSILYLLRLHIFKINVFNWKKYFRTDLTHSCTLTWYRPTANFLSWFALNQTFTLNMQLNCLYFPVKVKHMD